MNIFVQRGRFHIFLSKQINTTYTINTLDNLSKVYMLNIICYYYVSTCLSMSRAIKKSFCHKNWPTRRLRSSRAACICQCCAIKCGTPAKQHDKRERFTPHRPSSKAYVYERASSCVCLCVSQND